MVPPLPLWVWIEYEVVPRYIQLNLLAMRTHAADAFELRLLNRSTLGKHLTLPPEFESIPYAVAASDFARIGLLAEHGGLYMDADFLVTHPLASLRTLMTQHDVISYTDRGGDTNCSGGFSPNWSASPGIPPYTAAVCPDVLPDTLSPQKLLIECTQLRRSRGPSCGLRHGPHFVFSSSDVVRDHRSLACCMPASSSCTRSRATVPTLLFLLSASGGPPARHKICCYSHNHTRVPCRVPWALTDRVVQPIFKSLAQNGRRPNIYCFSGDHGFTPSADGLKCTRTFHLLSLQMTRHRHGVAMGQSQREPPSWPSYELSHEKVPLRRRPTRAMPRRAVPRCAVTRLRAPDEPW